MSNRTLSFNRTYLADANRQVRELQFAFLRELRRTFREEADTLFTDHDTLRTFSWDQASNPDNDYEFFVNRLDYKINGIDTKSISVNSTIYPAIKDINEFLDLFDDGDFQVLFGDHASVTVTNHGIDVAFHNAIDLITA